MIKDYHTHNKPFYFFLSGIYKNFSRETNIFDAETNKEMYTVWYRKTVPTLSSCHMESDHNKNLQRVRKGFLLRFKIAVYTSSPHPSNS